MKFVSMLAVGLLAFTGPVGADDKKDEKKKDDKFDAASLVGTWTVTGGKKAGADVSDMGKMGKYVITKDKITINNGTEDVFVFKYTVDAKVTPVAIDMEIEKGIEGSVGSKAKGIVEIKDGELKMCYESMGGDRPAKFDGEKFFLFTLKKAKKDDK